MLDVLSRSQRARTCTYTRNGIKLSTPAMLGSSDDGVAWVETRDDGRVLHMMGIEVPMESGLRTTSNSGIVSDVRVTDGIAVVRLPFKDDLLLDETVEMVVVPNAYELRKDPRRILDSIVRLRRAAGFGRLLYLSGLGEPSTVALLAYMGVDLFDDALPRAAGISGIRLIPEAEIETGQDESGYNAKATEEELEKVRAFIQADRLRELADQRAPASPASVALLRIYDKEYFGYAEETCPVTGCRFSCNTTQSLRRPDIQRYKERISGYMRPAHKRVLLLLPCSAKKPYHISKSHRAFSSAIHTGQHDTLVQEVIVTSPLGIVPRELDAFYPANSYDIPVTGEWKPEERAMIREMVGSVIDQGWDSVICHLGEDCGLVEGLADMTCTAVGDCTSPASIQNLDRALREATKGMEPADYLTDRNGQMRNMLIFQFGKEAAELLMDGGTYAVGKFPYYKLFREDADRGKVQLGMFTPERGGVSLTVEGAQILADGGFPTIEIGDFEIKGDLFAVGVLKADPGIRIGDEAIAVCNGRVRAVGVAMMCGREMADLKRGVAVKTRHKVNRKGLCPQCG